MKVVIADCQGQVGHCLVQQLEGKAEIVYLGINRLNTTDKEQVFEAVTDYQHDLIFYTAAYTAVDNADTV